MSVPPATFGDELESIKRTLMLKYSNKLLPEVGLCVCLCDVLEIGDAHLYHTDGAPWVRVAFRFVVFRPSIGEILAGTVLSSDAEGIRVSLGFFDEVLVPASHFRPDCVHDERTGLWKWQWKDYELWFTPGDQIMVRVIALEFQDPKQQQISSAPIAPSIRTQVERSELIDPEAKQLIEKENEARAALPSIHAERPNFRILGRVDEDGLGMTAWW